jgi:Asp-tRNA(Asn)/Glu-tRNA(Gln) amidotransferase A subunit family amidase
LLAYCAAPAQAERGRKRHPRSAKLTMPDALISFGSPGPAPRGLGSTGDSVFNSPTSILGAPAVTVPMLAIEGMPVGIQIVGQRHADARTAGIARWFLETMKPVSVD